MRLESTRTPVIQGMVEGLVQEMATGRRETGVHSLGKLSWRRGNIFSFVLQCKARLEPLGGTCKEAHFNFLFNIKEAFVVLAALKDI